MLRKVGLLGSIGGVLLLLYLLFWPVPVDPVAWDPPPDPGLDGPFAPYGELGPVEHWADGVLDRPEDVALDTRGRVYTGTRDGIVHRLDRAAGNLERFADTGGRPLGLDFDAAGDLWVADSRRGLLRISPDGAVEVRADRIDGRRLRLVNDVAVAPDGTVYFTEASSRFDQEDNLLDLIEHRPWGGLLAHDPGTGRTRLVLDSLYFANGVAVSEEGSFVLVAELSAYRIRRIWVGGPRAGESEIFAEGLPGFPDGIGRGAGVYWVALASPRSGILDALAPHPFLRKILVRIPDALKPIPDRPGLVLALDPEGRPLGTLVASEGPGYRMVTNVRVEGRWLWLGSMEENAVGRAPLSPPELPDPSAR